MAINDEYLADFLITRGYNPLHCFFVDAINGDDKNGVIDNITKPYKTWSGVHSQLEPGDMAVFRNGIHEDQINCSYPSINGTEQNPIIVLAYPGESAIVDRLSEGIKIMGCSHMMFDGLACRNTETKLGRGILMTESNNIKLLNIDSGHSTNGLFAMQDLHNIHIENCKFHDTDSVGTHGVYLGAREKPNSNITFKNNLIYNSGMTGFQHNGRVTNLICENNIIHSCNMGAISLIMGVSDSIFRNNLCFNNNQGVVLYNYVSTASETGILPYDQTNNLFINNTFWTGKYRHASGNSAVVGPEYFPAVTFNDDIKDPKTHEPIEEFIRSFDNNVFRNNIFVTCAGPTFRFEQQDFLDTTVIENNVIYRYGDERYDGKDCVLNYGGGYYDNHDFDYFKNFSELIKNNVYAWPEFKDVSIDYATTPEMFDFKLLDTSPAINFGLSMDAPTLDLIGNDRIDAPDVGCYEYFLELINVDITGDNLLNINDYISFLNTMGKQETEQGYNTHADYDNNNKITYSDFKTWYGYYIMDLE